MTILFFLIVSLILFPFLLAFYMLRFFETILPLIFWGPIYVPTKDAQVERIMKIADVKLGEKAVDLGAGDGRIVIALAKAGVKAYGCEINPLLVRLARKNILKNNVADKAFILQGNFWRYDLSDFDIITVYGMNHMMGKLERKLKKELKPGARVISNGFEFPSWPPYKKESNIYLYIKG